MHKRDNNNKIHLIHYYKDFSNVHIIIYVINFKFMSSYNLFKTLIVYREEGENRVEVMRIAKGFS